MYLLCACFFTKYRLCRLTRVYAHAHTSECTHSIWLAINAQFQLQPALVYSIYGKRKNNRAKLKKRTNNSKKKRKRAKLIIFNSHETTKWMSHSSGVVKPLQKSTVWSILWMKFWWNEIWSLFRYDETLPTTINLIWLNLIEKNAIGFSFTRN